jgi:hypothetical protein
MLASLTPQQSAGRPLKCTCCMHSGIKHHTDRTLYSIHIGPAHVRPRVLSKRTNCDLAPP